MKGARFQTSSVWELGRRGEFADMKGLQRDVMGKCRAYIAISRFNGKERANYCLGFKYSAGCPMMENQMEKNMEKEMDSGILGIEGFSNPNP